MVVTAIECPNRTFKNSWYIISVDGWSWPRNRETCQSQGGDLVSMETEKEWNFMNDAIQRRNTKSFENKWSIGLTKEKKGGNWTWVHGRPLTICKWGQGEPSGEHDAAFIYKRSRNGERGVFGSGRTIWKNYDACICEISKDVTSASKTHQTNPLEAKRCEFAQDTPITPKFYEHHVLFYSSCSSFKGHVIKFQPTVH
ncbi:hypothetical protein pdam_00025282 [Pocillopora damicornis]|uniref:C-type lectin domain-containing protein n=1 Tax=Pocillopora damicornis TaxID=46731 RepID=A0A3M6V0F6_POCDA|nr:hypothetical protein pdam_00025282 [Pocillopora damicornis]